jgi:hypothetical protein
MARFWWILLGTFWLLMVGLALWVVRASRASARTRAPPAGRRARETRPAARRDDPADAADLGLHISLFDVALVILGLSMTFWARRFAPIFYIFGAPVLLTWAVLLLRPLPRMVRVYGRVALAVGAGIAAIVVGVVTWTRAHQRLITEFEQQPQFNLLERVTRYHATSHDAILFLKNNNLKVNIVTEWTQAGPVMFYAPNAKVFMDGRAQQVYDEEHYTKYAHLLVSPDTPAPYRLHILDESGTDAVLLRRLPRLLPLWQLLEQSSEWVLALMGMSDGLFLRRGSPGLEQLGERLRRGEEWRPLTPVALASRGLVWQALEPPEPEQAVRCWEAALEQNWLVGSMVFVPLTETLLELGRVEEARQLVQEHYQRIQRVGQRLTEPTRRGLLQKLGLCWAEIEAAAQAASQPGAPDGAEGN